MLVLEKTPQTRHGPFWLSAERFCLSTHSESFGVIRWPECDCVCAGVGLSGGRGRLLTHVQRASACTLNAVGLLPVSGRGDARVDPPCPTTLCVWRNLPYLTLPYLTKLTIRSSPRISHARTWGAGNGYSPRSASATSKYASKGRIGLDTGEDKFGPEVINSRADNRSCLALSSGIVCTGSLLE